jgi:hypothetical protein
VGDTTEYTITVMMVKTLGDRQASTMGKLTTGENVLKMLPSCLPVGLPFTI